MAWSIWSDLSTLGFTFLVSTNDEACTVLEEPGESGGVTVEIRGALAVMFSIGPFHARVVFGL